MASPEEMMASMLKNLKEKTGKTLPEWLKVTNKSGLKKHGEIVKLLKTEHGVTHGFASLIAHKHLEQDKPAAKEGDQVNAQYAGKKAALRPIYDAIISAVKKLGNDVQISPKKTYVSLVRGKQFAVVQPSTATRIDVGLKMKGAEPTERLEDAAKWNQMVTHRVRVTEKKHVDNELRSWLKQAYDDAK